MKRRAYLGALSSGVLALAGCQAQGSQSRSTPPETANRSHSAAACDLIQRVKMGDFALEELSVDPNHQFNRIELSPNDSVTESIRGGSPETRYILGPGTYELDSINIPRDTIIEGHGACQTILRQRPESSNVHFLRASGQSRVQIQNLTVDVNAQMQPQRHTEGERGIQFNGGHSGIVRNVELVNAGGHSIKWFDWDGGVAHRVFSHSPAKTAPKPGGRGTIQAGASNQVTRNILVHACTLILPSKCISHRGTETESVLVTGSRLVDPGEEPDWIGVNLHQTANGLVSANEFVQIGPEARDVRLTVKTNEILITGNSFKNPNTRVVEDSVYAAPSTDDITLQQNVTGLNSQPPFHIKEVKVGLDDLTCDDLLNFEFENPGERERTALVTC